MLENAAVAREMKHVEKGEEGGQMGVGGGGGVYNSRRLELCFLFSFAAQRLHQLSEEWFRNQDRYTVLRMWPLCGEEEGGGMLTKSKPPAESSTRSNSIATKHQCE